MTIDISGLSADELDALEAQIAKRKAMAGAAKNVAAIVALKWAMEALKPTGLLHDAWQSILPQQYPKEGLAGRPADLSETEISEIRKKVTAALERG